MNLPIAICALLAGAKDTPAIFCNGHISRVACSLYDRPQNFYMLGSMGLGSAIALGILNSGVTTRSLISVDGDGNFLMGLPSMAAIGHSQSARLLYILLDNGIYGSTGGQRTLIRATNPCQLALSTGFRTAVEAITTDEITHHVIEALRSAAPSFLYVRVAEDKEIPSKCSLDPLLIAARFRQALTEFGSSITQ